MIKRNLLLILNLVISFFVFGTGLILFLKFHIEDGAHRIKWLGLEKSFWLVIHRTFAIGYAIGFAAHIQMHWKYFKMVANRWQTNLPKKIKSNTLEQILLIIAAMVVMWAGFYAWTAMPNATLEIKTFHDWIDLHTRVGVVFLIGMGVHIIRRWQRIF